MRIQYGILLLNILATVSAVQSHKITRRMNHSSPPSEQFLLEFDWNSFTQEGNGAFFSLMDALGKNLGPRFIDVHDCLRAKADQQIAFRVMYRVMAEGGAPPGYLPKLIAKETIRCFDDVVEKMRSDGEFSEDASEEEEESSEEPEG